ncbi:hypothetical protein HanRHA438_Chr07g0324531 [Helianthus annuus]|nr:hypothetical protein HanRHA438_Chr07g0324531 [Helianthus annuus]
MMLWSSSMEPMDLTPSRCPGCYVMQLVSSHRYLRISGTIHRPLVDVGRSNNYVFIINCNMVCIIRLTVSN